MNLITNNWNLKLMALALAVVLWGHVRSTVNPWETATFLVRLRSSAPPKMILVDAAKIPDTVKVTVGGPRLNLRQIKGVALANPLSPTGDVTSVTGGQVRAALDFSLARKGRQDVPVKAETSVEDVEVIGVNPANVEVVLDPAVSTQITVRPQLASRLAAGFKLEKVMAQPASVSVSGPSEVLERVVALRAIIKNQDLKINVPRSIPAPVEALDARGRTVRGVTIEPRTTRILATLREERITRRLRVVAQVKGKPAPGYRIIEAEVIPAHLSVNASRRAFADVASLEVPIDLNGITTSIRPRMDVPLPRGFISVGSKRVTVRVRIAPLKEKSSAAPAAGAARRPVDEEETGAPENGLPAPALPR